MSFLHPGSIRRIKMLLAWIVTMNRGLPVMWKEKWVLCPRYCHSLLTRTEKDLTPKCPTDRVKGTVVTRR